MPRMQVVYYKFFYLVVDMYIICVMYEDIGTRIYFNLKRKHRTIFIYLFI